MSLQPTCLVCGSIWSLWFMDWLREKDSQFIWTELLLLRTTHWAEITSQQLLPLLWWWDREEGLGWLWMSCSSGSQSSVRSRSTCCMIHTKHQMMCDSCETINIFLFSHNILFTMAMKTCTHILFNAINRKQPTTTIHVIKIETHLQIKGCSSQENAYFVTV